MDRGNRGRTFRAGFAGLALLLAAAAAWFFLAGRGDSPRPARAPVASRTTAAPQESADPRAPVPTDEGRPPAESSPVIRGRVVQLGGGPAAGAAVVLFPGGGRRPTYRSPESGQAVDPILLRDLFRLDERETAAAVPAVLVPTPMAAAPGASPVGSATAGEDGAFEIPVEGDGPFHLEASLEGAGSVALDGVPARGPPLTVVLGSAATLRGIVLAGPSRTPVAGASVLASRGPVVRLATTGPDGTFEIAGLIPGPCELLASAAGFPSVRLRGVDVPTERGPVEVVFGPSRTLLVRVTRRDARPVARKPDRERSEEREQRPGRQDAAPVAGATVVAWQESGGTYASAVTGADGTARLERLGAGSWSVAASAEGLLTGFADSYRRGAEGTDGEEEKLEIVLEPAVPKTVRVVDAAGAGVPGATVWWGGAERELDLRSREAAGTTGADGTVLAVFDERVPRKSALWVEPPEGATMRVEPSAREESGEVRAVVRPGRIVRGTVRDGGGRPVQGATVTLQVAAEGRDLGIGLTTSTDAKGSYAFPRVAFGAVRVVAEGELGYSEERRDGSPPEDPLVIDFRLDSLRD